VSVRACMNSQGSVVAIPTPDDLRQADQALRGRVIDTPLVDTPQLAERVGARSVRIKIEAFQRTGSFKFRGALWRCMALSDAERRRGVVAYSSGNFAQGLAAACQLLDVPSTIVMPIDAPAIKQQRTEGLGARVVLTDHGAEPREAVAGKRAVQEQASVLLHPFDDPAIVTGHASAAYEVGRACQASGAPLPDDVLCCVGGGGLIAGLALGFADLSGGAENVAGIRVVPVEPAGFDAVGQSLRLGERTTVTGGIPTICDALQAPAPGVVPFAVLRSVGTREPIAVTDDAVRDAMRDAVELLGLALEPSGAVPLAGLLSEPDRWTNRDVLIIASGRNTTAEAFTKHLQHH